MILKSLADAVIHFSKFLKQNIECIFPGEKKSESRMVMMLKSAIWYGYQLAFWFQKEKQTEIKIISWGSQLWVLLTLGGGNRVISWA